MNVTWVLEPDTFTPYHQRLVTEIESQGHVVRTVPAFYNSLEWSDTSRYYDDFSPAGSCVVCHASFQFTSLVAEDEVWVPGTYGIGEATDCSQYYPHLDDCLLNGDYKLLSLEEVANEAESLIKSLGIENRLFMRPSSGGKAFTGRLFTQAELQPHALRSSGLSMKTLVVISRPKPILREWRFVVVDRNVVAGSLYRELGELHQSPDVPAEALDFALQVASREFQPDRVWVLDTCETPDGEMKVVEINGFSSSNWYSCDLQAIVKAVSRVALDDWKRSLPATPG